VLKIENALKKYEQRFNEWFRFNDDYIRFLQEVEKVIDEEHSVLLLKDCIIVEWHGNIDLTFYYYSTGDCYISSSYIRNNIEMKKCKSIYTLEEDIEELSKLIYK